MPTIRVKGLVADTLGIHPLSHREAFIDCVLEADGQAVAMLRRNHPDLSVIPETYEVALADALEALIKQGRTEDITYWGSTDRFYLIHIPHENADIFP